MMSKGPARAGINCGCSSVVEHLLAKERVDSSNLFIRLQTGFFEAYCFNPIRVCDLA